MKKKLALALSLVLSLLLFAGCGPKEAPTSANNGNVDDSWDKIVAKGKIVMGLDIAFPPMGFKDENGELVGYDIDLAKAVEKELGVEIELKPIDWGMKETELNTNKIDIIWNGYSVSEERKEMVHFTPAYLNNRQIIIVNEGSDIKSKADLTKGKIGVQTGSTAVDAIEADTAIYEKIKDNIMQYGDNNMAMLDLDAGRTVAVVVDEVVGKYYMKQNPGKYAILSDNFGDEEYAVGIRKEDNAFYDKFVEAMKKVKDSGKAKEISMKWFGEDLSK